MFDDILSYLPADWAMVAAVVLILAILMKWAVIPIWVKMDAGRHERHVRRVIRRELMDRQWRERKLSTLRSKAFHPPRHMLSQVLLSLGVEQRQRSDGVIMVKMPR